MAAPLYIPSSTTTSKMTPPTSVSIKTTSYTVPAGKYAKVTVYYEGTEAQTASNANLNLNNRTITLNGSVIFLPPVYGFSIYDTWGGGGYTVTFPRTCRFSAKGMAFSTSSGLSIPSSVQEIYGIASNIVTDTLTTGNVSGIIYGDMGSEKIFFAKEGDVISGTGNWRAVVEEYTV